MRDLLRIGKLFFPFIFSACGAVEFTSKPISDFSHQETRYVIVTADDYGASKEIDEGIIEGVAEGFVNTVSSIVTFPRALKSIELLHKSYPDLPVGLHLSITSGIPLCEPENIPTLTPDGHFMDIETLIPNLSKVSIDELRLELEKQILAFKSTGVPLDHLSSQHNILHLCTPFLQTVGELALKYDVPVRSTRPVSAFFNAYSAAKTKDRAFEMAGNIIKKDLPGAIHFYKYGAKSEMEKNQKWLSEKGIPHTDYFVDSIWGTPTSQNFFHTLVNLPPGVSEIVVHLGKYEGFADQPPGIEIEYYFMRELELSLVTSSRIRQWFDLLNIEFVNFNDIGKKDHFAEKVMSN